MYFLYKRAPVIFWKMKFHFLLFFHFFLGGGMHLPSVIVANIGRKQDILGAKKVWWKLGKNAHLKIDVPK
jgi:hypothetical protein